eukprot:Gb_20241 [translate_table: standard]
MGIWWRGCSRSSGLFYQCRRRYSWASHISATPNALDGRKMVYRLKRETHILPYSHSNTHFLFGRGYAVLAKAKPKDEDIKAKEESKQSGKDPEGPRINKAITSDPVRLVTDKGHQVVSRREALEYAKKLKLDLVEVQRTAKPPVCKVMDFNREKYKQQQREKERSKNKSESAVRKGDCREVRFTAKTEQKDLERKAEMAKRLMDRGYRVKCMAMGTEDQNLEELLLRLSTLIEDVSIIESGPRVEKRNAWLIVRHIKFGPAKKKASQKTPKTAESDKNETENVNIKKSNESQNKTSDSVLLPKDEVEEWGQFEESASFEQFGDSEEEFPIMDRAEDILTDLSVEESFTSQKKIPTSKPVKQVEASAPFEQFGEFEAEEVSLVDRVEEIQMELPVGVSFTSQMSTSTSKPTKQVEFLAVDVDNDTATQAELGNSNAGQDHNASNTGNESSLNLRSKQAYDPVKTKAEDIRTRYPVDALLSSQVDSPSSETLKQVQPISADLNIGPAKQDQLGNLDAKHHASRSDLRQVIVGRSPNEKGKYASNIAKQQSVDSVPNLVNGSIKAKVKDIPHDHSVDISVVPEGTSNNVKQVQSSFVSLNNDAATQDQQEISNARTHVSGDGLRQVSVGRSSSSQQNYASKTEKQPHLDILPKQANESGGSIRGILKLVQPSRVDGDSNATTQDRLGIFDTKDHVLGDDTRHVLSDHSPSGQGQYASKMTPTGSFPKSANGSGEARWGIFGQPRYSGANVNRAAPTQNKIGTPNANQSVISDHSSEVLSGSRSSGLEHSASNNGKRTSVDMTLKQTNGSVGSSSGISKEGGVNMNAPSKVQVSNSKNAVPVDDVKQVLASHTSSGQGNHASNTAKQAPTDSFSKQTSASGGSRWGIFSASTRAGVDNQRHSAELTSDPKKNQPNNRVEPSSSKVGTDAKPKNLHLQSQMHVTISSSDAPKQAGEKPRQTGWGVFSMRTSNAPDQSTKHTDGEVKSKE